MDIVRRIVRLCCPTILTLVAGSAVASAQVIDLSQADSGGSAFTWVGTRQGASAGTSLLGVDISGDVDRTDLVVGAPGAGPLGQGQVFIEFMGPPHVGVLSLDTVDVILTGESAGDRFGASISAGMIRAREMPPLPPRDLVVGAPSAFGGNGAVYVFGGPFPRGADRAAASAHFTIIGAAGDQLGTVVKAADVDGDGYRDIVMTAPGSGRIYIVFGAASLAGRRDLRAQSADVTIGAPVGLSTLASADLNNDGFKDLAVGIPAAMNGAGAVFLVMGRARAAFSSTMTLASGADGILTGVAVNDRAGAAVDLADFDGDGVTDLIVAAPNAGSRAGRTGAGEVYVLWGGNHFVLSRSLGAADVTLRGAPNYHLGAAVAHGNVRRLMQTDLLLLAPGASAAGEVDVVYGASRNMLTPIIDLAGGSDRVLRGDPSNSPLQSIAAVAITGKNDDIVAAAPDATAGGFTGAGVLYNVYSPAFDSDLLNVAPISLPQGGTRTVPITVANVGTLSIGWTVRSNTPWWSVSPTSGTSSASAQGQLALTVTTGNLAPGTYQGSYTLVSSSRHLGWDSTVPLQLTVTPGTPGPSAPTNPFGYADPPDIGSPNGVQTPAGNNVSVIPATDFLVRFTRVLSPGRTWVTIRSAPSVPSATADGRLGPWIYSVGTTARFSGPVTVAIAYQDFAPQSQPAIRLYGRSDLTAWTDLGKHIIWGSGASVPGNYFLVVPKPTITSLIKSPSTVSAGARVSFTVNAEGSGGALAYQFWRYKASAGWSMVQDYSASSTFSWATTRNDGGDYYLQAWIKRADSAERFDVYTATAFSIAPFQPLTVTDVTSSESLPAPAGRAVTWTAKTSGGVEPIQYKFWRYDQSTGWSMVQDYGTSNTYTWATAPADQGSHTLQVWARSADSAAAYDSWNGVSVTLTSPAPLRATSVSADVTLPTPAGTTMSFTADTTGGVGPLQYRFWRYHASTGWRMVRDYDSSSKYGWSSGAGDVGSNAIQVWIRNAGSSAQYDAYVGATFDLTTPASPRITSLTCNVPTPVEAGSWMTWTAAAISGVPLEYKFWRYDPIGGWKAVQEYGPNPSYVWATAAEDQGSHYIQVWARRVGSTTAYDSWMGSAAVAITGPPPPTVTGLTTNVTLPATQGTTITWTATVSAATPVEYQFWRYDASGGWRVVQSYASSNTYSWTTGAADVGSHAIQVWVRALGSTTAYDAWQASGTFSINP